jgi:hypothetical protein
MIDRFSSADRENIFEFALIYERLQQLKGRYMSGTVAIDIETTESK